MRVVFCCVKGIHCRIRRGERHHGSQRGSAEQYQGIHHQKPGRERECGRGELRSKPCHWPWGSGWPTGLSPEIPI